MLRKETGHLALILIALSFSFGCGKKSKGGDSSPSNDESGDNGGNDGGGDAQQFDLENSGVLQLGMSSVGGLGLDFSNYSPEGANLPDVKAEVDKNTPGSLVIDGLSLNLLAANNNVFDCVGTSAGDWSIAETLFCRILGYKYDDGTYFGPFVYAAKLEEASQAAATINGVDEGFLCTRETRDSFSMSAGGVSFDQELSCWWPNGTGGGGTAFGLSDDKVWIRSQGYLAANISLDSNGDVTSTDMYVATGNGGSNDDALIRVQAYTAAGKARVEVNAVGAFNAKFDCGAQFVMDKDSQLIRMRYYVDTNSPFDCANDVASHTICFSAASSNYGNDETTACDGINFTAPFLHRATASTIDNDGAISGAVQLTQAQINAFGQDSDADLEALTSAFLDDPVFSISDLLFSTASSSLPEMIAAVDGKTAEIKSAYEGSKKQCLVEVPFDFAITSPLDLGLPTKLSCINSENEQKWDGFGQANGTSYLVDANLEYSSLDLFAFGAEGEVEAWLIRGGSDEASRSIGHLIKKSNGVEAAGVMHKSALGCGYRVSSDAQLLYATSTFDGDNCDGPVYEICYDQATASEASLAACREAGLDVASIAAVDPSKITHDQYANLVLAKPDAEVSGSQDLDEGQLPPIAAIAAPEGRDGAIDVIPLRNDNIRISKVSGGGINYGRNCKHNAAVGRASFDGVFELSMSDLDADDMGALTVAVSEQNAFISLNIDVDTTSIGSGAAITHDAALKVELLDASDAALSTLTLDASSFSQGAYVFFSLWDNVDLAAIAKIRVSATGTASESCAANSGQAHLSVGLADLRLRF